MIRIGYILAACVLLLGCGDKKALNSHVSVEDQKLKWAYPHGFDLSGTLLLKNEAKEPIEGSATIRGELELRKASISELSRVLLENYEKEDDFRERFDREIAAGRNLNELVRAMAQAFREGLVDEPTSTYLENSLDDPATEVYAFTVQVNVTMSPGQIQEVTFSTPIPREYSLRKVVFKVESVKSKGG
ncbi:MAG: hypothetical protein O3A87_01215 [Verrucomicrobia bacterium]|nr:hypothetical protein [Verrucomicrobiota bacterium]